MQAIDQALAAQVSAKSTLARQCAQLQSVSGIGSLCATWLANLFDRLPFAKADALVAYSGLDPRSCDSGHKRGWRRLSKRGSAPLSRVLFACAMAASRSKAFKPLYLALKARGLADTEALVILARKLLRVCFAIYKSGQPFDPARLGSIAA